MWWCGLNTKKHYTMQVKIYKDVQIEFNENNGVFTAFDTKKQSVIRDANGATRKFVSLKSVCNAIDKAEKENFKPVDALIVERKGYSPQISSVKRIKIIGEERVKTHARHSYEYYKIEGKFKNEHDGRIRSDEYLYPVKNLEALTKIVELENENEKAEAKLHREAEQLRRKREGLHVEFEQL